MVELHPGRRGRTFMNNAIRQFAIAVVAVTLAACAGTRVATDHDPGADFARYDTFAWLEPDHEKIEDPVLDSGLLTRKVEHAVATTLLQRGYARTDTAAAADFLVTYHTASRERLRDRGGVSLGIGFGHGWHRGYRGSVFFGDHMYFPRIESYQEGALIIDVLDARSRELVWRGWIRSPVTAKNYADEAIAAAVREILDQFPPGYVAPG